MSLPDRDVEAKIVVLGAQGVGKTALLNRYINNSFDAQQTPTIGANFLTKRLLSPDTHPPTSVRLQIWDTAGQERFKSIAKLYYRGAHAALLCYDITDEQSFIEMGTWLEELRKNLGQDCLIHCVGTKADVVADEPAKRQVPFERCIQYFSEHLQATNPPPGTAVRSLSFSFGMPQTPGVDPRNSGFWGSDTGWDCCHEISSKDGDGVEEVFRVLTRKLVEQRNQRDRQLEATDKMPGVEETRAGYFDQGMTGKGSFRLGLGDKRRSWLPFPSTPGTRTPWTAPSEHDDGQAVARGGCC